MVELTEGESWIYFHDADNLSSKGREERTKCDGMSVKTRGVTQENVRLEWKIGGRRIMPVVGCWWSSPRSLCSGGRRGRVKGKDDPGVRWSVSEQGVERMAVDWRIVDACVERQTREGSEVFGSRGGQSGQRLKERETRRDETNKDDSTRPIKLRS